MALKKNHFLPSADAEGSQWNTWLRPKLDTLKPVAKYKSH